MRAVYVPKSASAPSSSSSRSTSAALSSGSLHTRGLDQDDDDYIIELNPLRRERERGKSSEAMRRVDKSKAGPYGPAGVDGNCDTDPDSSETLINHGDGNEDRDENETGSGGDENVSSDIGTYEIDMGDVPLAQCVLLPGSAGVEEASVEIGGEEVRAGTKADAEVEGEPEDFGEFIGESSSFPSTLQSLKKRQIIVENDDEINSNTLSQPAYLFKVKDELEGEAEESLAFISRPVTHSNASPDTSLLDFSIPCTLKKKKTFLKRQQVNAIGIEDRKKPKKQRKIKETDCIDDIFADL